MLSYVVKRAKVKITAKFRASRRLRFEDTKRNMSPEKFRDFRETGPSCERREGNNLRHPGKYSNALKETLTTKYSSNFVFVCEQGAAATCEMNLMKSFKYGGRKTPPSKDELNQLVVRRRSEEFIWSVEPACSFLWLGGVSFYSWRGRNDPLMAKSSKIRIDLLKIICN